MLTTTRAMQAMAHAAELRPGVPSRRTTLAWLAWLAMSGGLAGCSGEAMPDATSIDLTGADHGRDFRLQDPAGRWRTLADCRGKLVLLFFGFTQCPDVCPTAMTQAVEVLRLVGDDGQRVQVLFVSLDPERDTPEILQAFVQSFHASFVALRGDAALTRTTAEHFKVFYRKAPLAGSYTIEHSALVYLYDREGRLRRALRPGSSAQAKAAAVQALLNPAAAGSA